jgi:HlyD family secretion protein
VELSTLWPDTVKRGPMLREVRGLGTLVPEDTMLITATTDSTRAAHSGEARLLP